jgi:hypothetical protein
VAPSATFNAPADVSEGSDINLSLTDVVDPGSSDTHTFRFSCDGGTTWTAFVGGGTHSCSTSDNGSKTVKGQVKDDDDGVSDVYSQTVTINNVAPTITGFTITKPTGAACAGASNTVTVAFGVTDPADNAADPITGTIDWGDGSTPHSISGRSVSQSHGYAPGGPYTINAGVNDGDGGTATAGGSSSAFSLYYATSGILQPINMTGNRSAFKLGSTIPVKLKITDCSGAPVSNLSLQISLLKLDGSPDGIAVEEFYSTVPDQGNLMRFTGSPDYQYIYNLGTKNLTQGDFKVTVSNATIAPVSAIFSLKK